jgi:DNA-binding transcriptional regulator YiaG
MNREDIIAIRTKLGMTQAKFATWIGATVVTISRWENGQAVPSRLYVEEIKRLMRKHGIKVC